MSTNTAFRLSTYLTLALACIALGHAIFPIFPEAGLFAGASVIALAVIYRLEVRVRLLSLSDANMLGGGIALCVAMWATYRIIHELRTGRSADLGWTLFGVALMGPLLMAAIPAKLLRREKHAGDYWQLHAAGLGAIVLAGAVDETPFTVIIMAAYTACAVWSLAQFQLARADGTIPPVPEEPTADKKTTFSGSPVRVLVEGAAPSAGFFRGLLLTIAAAIIAIPLYLLMPRSSFGKQEFGKPRIEIGYAADQMIDLNRSGKLESNREVAFTVEARQQNKAKTDLNSEQRWRGRVLTQYRSGTWQRDNPAPLPALAQTAVTPRFWSPPDLGPDQFELRFTVPVELGTNFLADPVIWKPDEAVPVADVLPGGAYRPWHALSDGSIIRTSARRMQEPNLPYIQVYRPLKDPALGPPFGRANDIRRELLDNPVPAVREYADSVLQQLVERKVLPPAVLEREPRGFHVPLEYHEAVARAFEDYLSHHAGLSYTTELRRVNRSVDPVEDFLLYSRAGHCERFASGLVLMLRSKGIPAVAVLGFKGCEHTGEGRYEIRHEHAHVWAEALISRPDNAGDGRVWHWLSLDPSPTEEAQEAGSGKAARLLTRASDWSRDTLDRYLIRYSPEEQRRALSAVTGFLATSRFLFTMGILTAGGLAVLAARRYRKHPRRARLVKESAWLDPLLGVLAAAGYHTATGQTPREFATTVTDMLEQHFATRQVASVPGEWVEVYYRTRFGGVPTSDFVQSRLELRLEELRAALIGANR